MTRVLVAGAGIAAVECVLALRELAGPQLEIELLAPAAELVHRPSSVQTPFGAEAAARIDLSALAQRLDVQLRRDSLAAVAMDDRQVVTRGADRRDYDFLVVATGAPSRDAVHGAVTFRGPAQRGRRREACSAAPPPTRGCASCSPPRPASTWPLPIYELALLSAAALRERGVAEPDITVVTAEAEPARRARRRRGRRAARDARARGHRPRDRRRPDAGGRRSAADARRRPDRRRCRDRAPDARRPADPRAARRRRRVHPDRRALPRRGQ